MKFQHDHGLCRPNHISQMVFHKADECSLFCCIIPWETKHWRWRKWMEVTVTFQWNFLSWYTSNWLLLTQIYDGAYLCNQTQKSTEYHIYVTFKEFPKTRMSPEIKKLKSAGVSVICLGHFKENEISSPHWIWQTISKDNVFAVDIKNKKKR